MKKRPLTSSILGIGIMCFCTLCFSSCNDDYDDTELWNNIDDLENRLASLEEWQKSVNSDIQSLQSLIEALEDKDYVTGVTPLDNGTGYIITFLKSGSVTIRHGEKGDKGDKGNTPVISVKQDGDGKYYWTVDGEWLIDGSGNKMPVTGEKGDKGNQGDTGSDGLTPHIGDNGNWWIGATDSGVKAQGDTGADGQTPYIGDNGNWWIGTTDTGMKAQGNKGADAIAPQVRINNETNEWEISTDGGGTWASTGVKATGDKGDTGDSMFESIDDSNPSYVVITLENGETIILPKVIADKNSVYVDTAGGLQQAVQDAGIDAATATKLTITGTLGNDDFAYLKANFFSLNQLDLSELDITVLPERALQGMPFEAVVLPSGLKEIKNVALGFCSSLRTLEIPESVETLGRWIVERCNYLETVTLHNGLKTLSPSTFYGCGITSIHIPTTVTEIPDWCFQSCKNLERIYLHDDIATIGEGAFFDCLALESFTAPQSLTILSECLFYRCSSLRLVTIHDNITEIGTECFSFCTSLSELIIDKEDENDSYLTWPKALRTMGISAFANSGLKHAHMYDSQLLEIPAHAFESCDDLSAVSLPAHVEKIGDQAFNSIAIPDLMLPETTKELGNSVFSGCKNLWRIVCKAITAPTITSSTFPASFKENCQLYYPTGSDYSSWTSYFFGTVALK